MFDASRTSPKVATSNVARGRESCGDSLVDVHADPDHHRSVFTLAGPAPDDAAPAARKLAGAVATHVSMAGHDGVHPRFGALDVVPFVALGGTDAEHARAAATAATSANGGRRPTKFPCSSTATPIPAVATSRTSGATRSDRARPTSGPRLRTRPWRPAVGARKPLVAVNLALVTDDVTVAHALRASS